MTRKISSREKTQKRNLYKDRSIEKRSLEIQKMVNENHLSSMRNSSQISKKSNRKKGSSIRLNKMLRSNIGDVLVYRNPRNISKKSLGRYSKSGLYQNILENLNTKYTSSTNDSMRYGDVYINSRREMKKIIQSHQASLRKSQIFKEDENEVKRRLMKLVENKTEIDENGRRRSHIHKYSDHKGEVFKVKIDYNNENPENEEEIYRTNYNKKSTKAETETPNEEEFNREEMKKFGTKITEEEGSIKGEKYDEETDEVDEEEIKDIVVELNLEDKIREEAIKKDAEKANERHKYFLAQDKKTEFLIQQVAIDLKNENIKKRKKKKKEEGTCSNGVDNSNLSNSGNKPTPRTASTNNTTFKNVFIEKSLLTNQVEKKNIKNVGNIVKQPKKAKTKKEKRKPSNRKKKKRNKSNSNQSEKKLNSSTIKNTDEPKEQGKNLEEKIENALEEIRLNAISQGYEVKEKDPEPLKPIPPPPNLLIINEEENGDLSKSQKMKPKKRGKRRRKGSRKRMRKGKRRSTSRKNFSVFDRLNSKNSTKLRRRGKEKNRFKSKIDSKNKSKKFKNKIRLHFKKTPLKSPREEYDGGSWQNSLRKASSVIGINSRKSSSVPSARRKQFNQKKLGKNTQGKSKTRGKIETLKKKRSTKSIPSARKKRLNSQKSLLSKKGKRSHNSKRKAKVGKKDKKKTPTTKNKKELFKRSFTFDLKEKFSKSSVEMSSKKDQKSSSYANVKNIEIELELDPKIEENSTNDKIVGNQSDEKSSNGNNIPIKIIKKKLNLMKQDEKKGSSSINKKKNFDEILNSSEDEEIQLNKKSDESIKPLIRIYEEDSDFKVETLVKKKINLDEKFKLEKKIKISEEKQPIIPKVEDEKSLKNSSNKVSISSFNNSSLKSKLIISSGKNDINTIIQEVRKRKKQFTSTIPNPKFSSSESSIEENEFPERKEKSVKKIKIESKEEKSKTTDIKKENENITAETGNKIVLKDKYEKDLNDELLRMKEKGSENSLSQSIDSHGLFDITVTYKSKKTSKFNSKKSFSVTTPRKEITKNSKVSLIGIEDGDLKNDFLKKTSPKDILNKAGILPKRKSNFRNRGLIRNLNNADNTKLLRRRGFMIPGGKKNLIPGINQSQLKSLREFHEENKEKRTRNGDFEEKRVIKIGEGLYDFLFVETAEQEEDIDELIIGERSKDPIMSDYSISSIEQVTGFRAHTFGQEIRAIEYLYIMKNGEKKYGNLLGNLKGAIKEKIIVEEYEWDSNDRVIQYFASFSTGLVFLRFLTVKGESFSVGSNVYEPTRKNYVVDIKRRRTFKAAVKIGENRMITALLFLLGDDESALY